MMEKEFYGDKIMPIFFSWETIFEDKIKNISGSVTMRSKVIGGWLVKDVTYIVDKVITESMVFVPDPNHLWEVS